MVSNCLELEAGFVLYLLYPDVPVLCSVEILEEMIKERIQNPQQERRDKGESSGESL